MFSVWSQHPDERLSKVSKTLVTMLCLPFGDPDGKDCGLL